LRVKFYESNLPERRFNIVVLPDPEGPRIAVIVLGANFPEHSFKIVLLIFCFLYLPSSPFIYLSMIAATEICS